MLSAPPRGHAMLLTKKAAWVDIPPSALSTDSAHTSTQEVLRGIGVVHDHRGNFHFFRTAPFVPPSSAQVIPRSSRPDTSTSRSMDIPAVGTGETPFARRKISLTFPDYVFKSKQWVKLAHISVRPLGAARGDLMTVYPNAILEQVLNSSPHFADQEWVEWSDRPNWSSSDRKAAAKAMRDKARETAIESAVEGEEPPKSSIWNRLRFGRARSSSRSIFSASSHASSS